MDPSALRSKLQSLPFKIGERLLAKTQHLLQQELMDATPNGTEPSSQLYAALAIAAETEACESNPPVPAGSQVTVESIMGVLNDKAAIDLIISLSQLLERVSVKPAHLAIKMPKLKLLFHLYLKFQRIVKQFAQSDCTSDTSEMGAIGWLLYLYVRNNLRSQEYLPLLPSLMLSALAIAQEVLRVSAGRDITGLVRSQFGVEIDGATVETAKANARGILHSIKRNKRDSQEGTAAEELKEELIRAYRKAYPQRSLEQIDEVMFIHVKASSQFHGTVTQHPMDFDSAQSEGKSDREAKLPMDLPKFNQATACETLFNHSTQQSFAYSPGPGACPLTPYSSTLCEFLWLKERTDPSHHQPVSTKLNSLFNEVSSNYYDEVKQICMGMVIDMLRKYWPQYRQMRAIADQTLRLFEYFLVEICKGYSPQEQKGLVGCSKYLLNMLCLVSSVVLSIYKMPVADFRQFCECFKSSYLEVFRLINKTGKFDSQMPLTVKLYLCNLEKLILLVYIWEDEQGYKIINRQNKDSKIQKALEDRLQKHIYDRIFEVHRLMNLGMDILEKTKAALSYVLNEKACLLKNNYIDQIILCCLFTALRVSPAHTHVSLQDLFERYSALPLIFSHHKYSVRDLQGNEVSLLDFYNRTFSQSIKGLLIDQYAGRKFLLTPVKQQLLNRSTCTQGTPLTKLLQHTPGDSSYFSKQKLDFEQSSTDHDHHYQNKLSKKINVILLKSRAGTETKQNPPAQPEEQELQVGCRTPAFPNMQLQNRSYSFGRVNEDTPTLNRSPSSNVFSILNAGSQQSEKEDE